MTGIINYKIEDITTYVTPCPYLDEDIKVGSKDCLKCVDCLGHNQKKQTVSCRNVPEENSRETRTVRQRLEDGETFETWFPGNSMTPIIYSNQHVIIAPAKWKDVEVNDVVYAQVAGRYYTHLVKAKNSQRGILLGNNHGHNNGWTKKVFGKVIKIL